MKRFLIRILLFLLITIGSAIVLFQLVPKDYLVVADDYRSIELKKKMVGLINNGYYGKVNIVVGDSKLNRGIYAKNLNAVNISLQGGSPAGTFVLLSQLDFSMVDTIFLGYSLHHFHINDVGYIFTRFETEELKNKVKELYVENRDDEHLIDEFREARLSVLFSNIKALAYAKDISQNIYSPLTYINNLKEIEQQNEEILAQRGSKLSTESCKGIDEDYEYGKREFNVAVVYDYYLNEVLNLIKEKKKPLIYIVPPIKIGNKRPGEAYYDAFDKYIVSTLGKHGFNQIIPSKEYKCDYFKDNVHLNKEGAILYTKHVREYFY